MENIQLQAIPNQSLTTLLDGDIYNISIHETSGTMSISISRNNLNLISGFRLVSGSLTIPYDYLQKGNFSLITDNNEYPYYTLFGITQFLIFASKSEIEAIDVTV